MRSKVCYELFFLGLIIGTEDYLQRQEAAGRERGSEARCGDAVEGQRELSKWGCVWGSKGTF